MVQYDTPRKFYKGFSVRYKSRSGKIFPKLIRRSAKDLK